MMADRREDHHNNYSPGGHVGRFSDCRQCQGPPVPGTLHVFARLLCAKLPKHLRGKYARHPFIQRRLPVITDDMVDMNFGTGAVAIRPAHDPLHYEVGKRHNLPFINILNDDGTLNAEAGEAFKVWPK
jgi:hypothetical protein